MIDTSMIIGGCNMWRHSGVTLTVGVCEKLRACYPMFADPPQMLLNHLGAYHLHRRLTAHYVMCI